MPRETIKARRELHEWSQVELSEMTGITQATISTLETGRTALGSECAKVIARAFNIYPGVILFSDWKREDPVASLKWRFRPETVLESIGKNKYEYKNP